MKNPLITMLVAVMVFISAHISSHAEAQALWMPETMGGVSGAPAYYNQYNGSGQGMMNYCPYAQTAYDPSSRYDKDPDVASAKSDLKDINASITDLNKKIREAESAYRQDKRKLEGAYTNGVDPDSLMKQISSCDKASNLISKNTDTKAQTDVISSSGVPSSAQMYCFKACAPIAIGGTFNVRLWCNTTPVDGVGDLPKAPRNTGSTEADVGCADQLETTYGDFTKIADLKLQLKRAQKDASDAKEGVDEAVAAAAKYAQDNPGDASVQGCPNCMIMQQQQQQSQGLGWKKMLTVLGVAGAVAGGTIYGQIHQCDNIARMGYLCNPNTVGAIGMGASNGMGIAYPLLQSGQYGQTAMGSARGGFGCAQTINGSQLAMQPGPFMNGPYGGNYFPAGGQYMPGAGPWGVSPYPGMPGMMGGGMPGMMGGGMPGMMGGGMPGMMGGMPGMMGGGMPGMMGGGMPGMMGGGMPGMMGGYNPYAQQAQYAQYLSTMYMDQLRQEQVAMYAVGYGLNNANQQYAYAQSILGNGMGGMGTMGMPGMMPAMGGTYLGGSPYGGYAGVNTLGFANYSNPCGAMGSTFSICGSTGFGGSYMPTNTNYNYGVGYQNAGFGNTGYGIGGLNGFSTTGTVYTR